MARYARTRLALALPTILLTSLVVFLMLVLIPGDPASIYAGEPTATPQRLAPLPWLPATSGPGTRGLVLPAVSLALLSAATLARLIRASILDVLRLDYLTTARAKGLAARVVVLRHALPNAILPVVTAMGLQF